MLLHLDPKRLDQSAVLNSRWAGGFATAAIETKIEVTLHVLGQLDPPVGDRPHQIDPSARAVIFIPGFEIRGTRCGAKPTMDAIEKSLVVDPASDARKRGC